MLHAWEESGSACMALRACGKGAVSRRQKREAERGGTSGRRAVRGKHATMGRALRGSTGGQSDKAGAKHAKHCTTKRRVRRGDAVRWYPSSTEDRSSPRAPSSSLSLGSYGMEIQCVCNAPPASPTRSSAPARPPQRLPIPPSSRSVVRGQKRSAWSSQHIVCLAHAALRSERSSLYGRRKPQGKEEVSSSHKDSGGNAARRGDAPG